MFTSRLKSALADNLARAILALRDEEDCYKLFEDLFTIREIQDLSQRLEVARLLQANSTYTEIVEKTGVSTATIGRVNRALNYGAGGYQLVLERIAEERPE
ncbi:MAG: YerC/YecD family TrpR-related protein [bacterium]